MNEDVNNTPAPEGGNDGPLPEVREAGGTRRPMNATEARVFRERQEAMKSKPAPKPAEGEGSGEEQPTERHQEEAEEQQGEKTESGLTVPVLVPQEFREETTQNIEIAGQLGKELGIEQGTMQSVVDYAVALGVSDQSGVDLADQDACLNVLMSRYGNDEGAKIVADAQKAVKRLGPKAEAFLDESQLGNSPAVLMALASFQRGEFHMSPETAQAELDKLTKGEDLRSKPYFNSDDPMHKFVADRATLLYMRATKAGDVEAQPKAEAAKVEKATSAQADLDRRIKEAVADPAYRDENHPKHREAVDRASKLYELRWRD